MLAAAVLLLPGAAAAADWGLETLMRELGARRSGEAHFTETKHLAVLDRPIEQSGTLAFAPGRLEKFTRQPHRERMIVDGDTLTIESGAGGRTRRVNLQRYPAVWGFIEGLRATLTGDLATLQRFYQIELHGTADDWELVLVPVNREMAAVVRMISIRGAHRRLAVVEIVHNGSERTVMRITEDAP